MERSLAIARHLDDGSQRALTRAVNIARTGFWFEQLVRATERLTPNALGKFLQPDTYRKNQYDEQFNPCLWPKYAKGEVVPRPKLLRSVDAVVAGSYANFYHVIFDVLNPASDERESADLLLRRVHPGVQRAVFEPDGLELGYYRRRQDVNQILRDLEFQGHLDALAAAIILLGEANAAKDEALAFEIAITVHRTLLIACATGPGTCIRLELLLLVSFLWLWPLESLGRRFATSIEELDEQCGQLNTTILRLEDRYWIGLLPRETIQAAGMILRGDYGEDLRLGLMPRLAAVGRVDGIPVRSQLDLLRDEVLGGWARRELAEFRFGGEIPEEVRDQLKQKSRALHSAGMEQSATR